MTVRLGLTDVATGVKKSVRLKTLDRCSTCAGTGAKAGSQPVRCTTCAGSGEVRRAARSMFGQFVSVSACPTCAGEGQVIREPCEVCRGEGRVKGERTVQVEIPAGVSSNNYLTLRGQGAAGPRNGPSGDLLVMLEVKDDDRFERQGDDLVFDLPLSFSQAALGSQTAVPTPYGDEEIRIPAGHPAGDGAPSSRQGAARCWGSPPRAISSSGCTCGPRRSSPRSSSGSSRSCPSSRESPPSARPASGRS